ncbi:hypothetical protein MNB_SUP05-SYMBIONT-7-387 [hydrothermal vent metagenome]|uniref:DUF8196 domain-containing protein n=1 Tax=hydrothermal vent metagenome TaxID=652676 RepID=A0A1W1E499_9ZZZZ
MEKELNITDLLQSIRELRISQRASYQELSVSQEKSYQELRVSQEKTDKQVRALTKDIFGISTSMGLEAEEFFYNAVKEKMQLAGIKFDYASRNDKIAIKGEKQEIDIILENGNYIGVIEVKNKVTKNTIKQMDKIIEKFYYFHPHFKNYKLIGAIAGKVFSEELIQLALKKGYSVLTQKGEYMEQINP